MHARGVEGVRHGHPGLDGALDLPPLSRDDSAAREASYWQQHNCLSDIDFLLKTKKMPLVLH